MTALRVSLSLAMGLLLCTTVSAEEARGRIVQIDKDKKMIRLEARGLLRRTVLDVKIDAKTQIVIGGQPATLNDLMPNQRIRVLFQPRGGKAVAQAIHSFGLMNLLQPQPAAPAAAAQPAAAQPKEGEGVAGTLQRIALTDREIVLIGPGRKGAETETTIIVPEQTAITRDGKKIALDDLKEGETATVKTESRKGRLTAVSVRIGQAAAGQPAAGQAAAGRPAAPPRRKIIPRLRQALKRADDLLREMEEQGSPAPDRP